MGLVIATMLTAGVFGQTFAQSGSATSVQVARGHTLAIAADCVACHTAPGGAPYAGGRAINTPFGVIHSRNLTPDEETGIGLWSEADFYRALHEGKSRDGSHLYPAFPYPYFTRITRADAADLKAYLDSLAPVQSPTPPNRLPFPLNQRGIMVAWNSLFFRAAPEPAPTLERGAYLVEVLGHCGACHTPKNWLGADKSAAPLQGGEIEHWLAPNSSGDQRSGLGQWSEDEIVEYLQTGRNARALAAGPMAEVVEVSTSKMNAGDLRAIARYLKRLPAAGLDTQAAQPKVQTMATGEAIFVDACAACHQASGTAVPRMFAPLKGSAIVQAENPLSVIRLILQGARSASTDARPSPFSMPAFAWKLDDAQVAAVASYVRIAWGNVAPVVSAAEVSALRKQLEKELRMAAP